ncbi:MAG TPA: hypothetical protein VMV86_01540 [Methanosarcinales archaeon]|nr:hypothetical protein [Methanosarcinales archaeon]
MKKITTIFHENGELETVNDGLNDGEILLVAKQLTLSVEWTILRQWQAAEQKEKQTEVAK